MRDADRRGQVADRERAFGQQRPYDRGEPGPVLGEALIPVDLGYVAVEQFEDVAEQGADGGRDPGGASC